METKLSKLRAAMEADNWRRAVSIASKFSRLGKHKAAIKRGQDAFNNPRFLKQIGRDPVEEIEKAKTALIEGWGNKTIKFNEAVA